MDEKKIVMTVNLSESVKELGDLFGIFFEDLNHAADGGLYGELVQNRSFEFDHVDNAQYHALYAWEKIERGDSAVQIHVENAEPLNANNEHYLIVEVTRAGNGAGVKNLGYEGGIWLCAGEEYEFSCWYRGNSSDGKNICVRLEDNAGRVCSTEKVFQISSKEWTKKEICLKAIRTGAAQLCIFSTEVQTFYLDMVSLFPKKTFQGRKNGLRKDIAQLLADMKPKFMRFPGGCLVHCGSLNAKDRVSQYRWKNTLGNVENRPSKRNTWGYNQTLGMGYYEFFCLCEDIGTEPLPVISAGWDPHTLRAAPLDQMQEWIDEALDLIEFANGDESTKWGQIRAQMGHSKPFGLKYLGIGNEEVGDPFFERFEIIHSKVKERFPNINLIGSAGPGCAGEVFEQGWESARKMGSSYVDEHYYQSTDWILANIHRYDNYSAEGPKAFLGEYATKDETYYNALVEAAFMTGMEKALGLGLACYAPLLCNANYVNWKPDLIWFDNHQAYGTACYQVQKLFMNHQGDYEVTVCTEKMQKPAVKVFDLSGGIVFQSEHEIAISNIKIKNSDTDECICCENFKLSSEHQTMETVGNLKWKNYSISFEATRLFNSDTERSQPLNVHFGYHDEENYKNWMIDGWSQTSSINVVQEGRFSDLGLYYAPAAYGKTVQYCLKVTGAMIQPFVNGVCHEMAEYKGPVIEELYYTASVECESGDLIIKAVNLKTYPVSIQLDIKNGQYSESNQYKSADIWELSGYKHEDVNTFEEPQKIVPIHRKLDTVASEMTFAPESVNVIRLHHE